MPHKEEEKKIFPDIFIYLFRNRYHQKVLDLKVEKTFWKKEIANHYYRGYIVADIKLESEQAFIYL